MLIASTNLPQKQRNILTPLKKECDSRSFVHQFENELQMKKSQNYLKREDMEILLERLFSSLLD